MARRQIEYAPDQPKYERGKTVGKLREEARYGGDPGPFGSPYAFHRKDLDTSYTSDDPYMKEALKETGDVLRKSAQANIDRRARKEIYDPGKRKASMARQTRLIKPRIEAHRAQRRKIIASRKAY